MRLNENSILKESDLELLRDLPKSWSRKKLRQIVDPNRPITYGIVQPGEFAPNGIFLVRGKDYSNRWAKPEELFKVSEDIESPYKRARLKKGDLILTIVGAYTGNVAIVPPWLENSNITQTTARVAISAKFGYNQFYYYFFESEIGRRVLKKYEKGLAQPGLNLADIAEFIVPVPTKNEQKKIASILQSVDNAIDKTKELIEKYKKMKQGLMQDLFNENWGFKPLSSFATLKGRIGWRGYTTSDLVDEGPLAIGAGNISVDNKLDLTQRVHISRKKYEESPDIMVKQNDVLIVQRGSLGKVAIVDRHIGEATINPSMILVKEIKTNPYFIYYNLSASHIQKEIADNLAQTGVPMITQDQCKNFKIYNPPDPEKEKIVTILLSIDSKIDSEKSYLRKLVKIKGGLMQDLLTGKVRVAA